MPSEDISVKTFGSPLKEIRAFLIPTRQLERGGQRLTESFTTMSRKHSTLFSRNSEREVMPETRPRMNCVCRRRPRNFSSSHSTSDLISSRLLVAAVATFTYPRPAFFLQALEKWASLSLSRFLSRACHDRVNVFYCSFAMIVEYIPALSFARRLIFHSPINPPVGPDFSARNHEIPPRASYRRGIKRVPFSRGHEVHEIQLSRAARSAFDPWPGCAESSRLFVPTFRLCRASPATFAVPRISSYGENIATITR